MRAKPVPLAEFLPDLREELRAAEAACEPGLQFAVDPVAMEVTVVAAREIGLEARVPVQVVDGGSARWSKEATQKMSLTLPSVDEHCRPICILDRLAGPSPRSRTSMTGPSSS